MKIKLRLFKNFTLLLVLFVIFSNLKAQQSPPFVEIISPVDNSILSHDVSVQIIASASDSNGSIVKIEFTADDLPIGEVTSAPYQIMWQPPKPGNYDLRAIATDNDGEFTVSRKIDVLVQFPQYDNKLTFSHVHGFYTNSFILGITSDSTNVTIRYTLDGSDPRVSNTSKVQAAPASILISPTSTVGRGTTPGVVIRAVGLKNNNQHTAIYTQTFLFVDKVKEQAYPGGSWPGSGINNQVWTYDMNWEVVNDARYRDVIDDALLDIPSISLVTDLDNLFASDSGIYVNAEKHGYEWERPVSVELLNPDGTSGFHIDAGLRIRGGWSRHPNYPKHAFRLFFREEYGKSRLEYPLFGTEGVSDFKNIDLRTSQNYAWSNGGIYKNTMNRDVFSRDVQAGMGQLYTRSRYYHLYINGLYWGLFQSQERPESNFAESYLGGKDRDYDIVKVDIGENWNLYEIEATDGNLDAWQEVWDATQTGFSSILNYFKLEGRNPDGSINENGKKLVDIDNLIDYMLIIFYGGNFDAPVSKFRGERDPNNFYAIYNRAENEGFKFLAHDAEHTLHVTPSHPGIGLEEDRVNIDLNVTRFEKFHPQWLHKKLTENKEYRVRFADRVYKHFFNEGVMQQESLSDIFQMSADQIDMAIIAESARWGDLLRSKHNAWIPAVDDILSDFIPDRGDIVLDQLISADLFTTLKAPVYRNGGQTITRNSLKITSNFELEISNPNGITGSIKYTMDNSDPRLIGGSVSAKALDAGDNKKIIINGTVKILARIYNAGNWSPLHEIILYGIQDLNTLELTEIHYHPLDEVLVSGKSYEFLEFKNTGNVSLDMSMVSMADGVIYSFASGTMLNPGEFYVLASDSIKFNERYGFMPSGQFEGQLNNGGEKLALFDPNQDTLIALHYDDSLPWPVLADGYGNSLVWTNKTGNYDENDPGNWTASSAIHGSPGNDDLASFISESDQSLPQKYKLHQNYPNPFNPATTINYELPITNYVDLSIYNLLGQKITTLVSDTQPAGVYKVKWDASQLAGGVYFYKIEAGEFQQVKKMILIK